MEHRLSKIFNVISFYDHFRWSNKHNYNLINFYNKNIDDDSKILTHWFCYIADRQMPFKIIWDVGGFVFSELTHEIKKHKTYELLNPTNKKSFIHQDNSSDKYVFISKSNANTLILDRYKNYTNNKKVQFKSRFLPSDYFCMLYSLVTLKDYNYSFSRYISSVYIRNRNNRDIIKRILFSLYLLTYYDIGQPNSIEIDNFNKNIKKALDRKNRIREIIDNNEIFEDEYNKFKKEKIFKQKRAWCSLRDFMKSPEFQLYFINSLKQNGLHDEDFKKLFSKQALEQLELPGDVWNNNSKFRKCILSDTEYSNSKNDLNIILRTHFEKFKSEISGYPEQFDITFDFVPRMCEQNNCNICPIYNLSTGNDFNKICIKNESFYCSVALISCNYKNECLGKTKCNLLQKHNCIQHSVKHHLPS